jgi:hypothetical protein
MKINGVDDKIGADIGLSSPCILASGIKKKHIKQERHIRFEV